MIARYWPGGDCDEIPTLENNWINWKTIKTEADIGPGAKLSQGFKVLRFYNSFLRAEHSHVIRDVD